MTMDVLFAVLPFADRSAPALGVSLLKAEIARLGFTSQIRYFALDLAEEAGLELYSVLSGHGDDEGVCSSPPTESLLGEWFFAGAAFGERLPDVEDYVSRFLRPDPRVRRFVPRILKARRRAAALADAWADEIRALRPRVVGFTSVFHQTCASLAVANRLKAVPDSPVVVFGGANCAGEMGLQMIRSFSCIDYVCTGEADGVFPAFLTRLLREGDPRSVPGIVRRGEDQGSERAALVRQLDDLPVPDYSEYFGRLRASPLRA